MKKTAFVLLSLAAAVILSACGSGSGSSDKTGNGTSAGTNSNTSISAGESGDKDRILIAYFSVPEDVKTSGTDAIASASIVVRDKEIMGNTEYVAELVQQTVGGDLFQIETTQKYPLEHEKLVDQAADEQEDEARPKLSSHVENFEEYGTIILGFPNWWADLPMPVYSFLEEYDFGGKTIIPFVTHGGSGFSGTLKTISDLQPNARVSDNTLSLSRNDVADCEKEVKDWAQSLGVKAAEQVQ